MTKNVYRTAQGKMVDMGALTLQNEMVRAVGNMNVNARGDRVDGTNQVIDQRNRQVQRQHQRNSNVNNTPAQTSTVSAKKSQQEQTLDPQDELPVEIELVNTIVPARAEPVDQAVDPAIAPASGLAAALAKAKTVKQTLDPNARERAQAQGLRKI
jgi:hypothetical protein